MNSTDYAKEVDILFEKEYGISFTEFTYKLDRHTMFGFLSVQRQAFREGLSPERFIKVSRHAVSLYKEYLPNKTV